MTIVTTVTTVSYRYYEKRRRSVVELNIEQMCRVLGKPHPEGLAEMTKHELIMMALNLHNEFPE